MLEFIVICDPTLSFNLSRKKQNHVLLVLFHNCGVKYLILIGIHKKSAKKTTPAVVQLGGAHPSILIALREPSALKFEAMFLNFGETILKWLKSEENFEVGGRGIFQIFNPLPLRNRSYATEYQNRLWLNQCGIRMNEFLAKSQLYLIIFVEFLSNEDYV